jgi:hypothetical protein
LQSLGIGKTGVFVLLDFFLLCNVLVLDKSLLDKVTLVVTRTLRCWAGSDGSASFRRGDDRLGTLLGGSNGRCDIL